MDYFIIINDVQQGPFSLDELRTRHITSDTLVWAEGMPSWVPAWQVEELKPLLYGEGTAGTTAGNAQTATQSSQSPQPAPPPYQPHTSQQPYHPQSSQPTPPPYQSGHNRKRTLTYIGIAAVVVLLIMAMTNPSKDEHRQVIKEHITEGITKGLNGDSDDIFSMGMRMFTRAIATPLINSTINDLLQYHNYVFFSTTTIDVPEHGEQRTSLGIFGKVFTSDEEAIAAAVSSALKDEGAGNTQQSETTTTTESGSPDGSDGSGFTQQVTDTVVSVGNKVGRTVVKHVSSEIKKELDKQIDQNTDSATASGLTKIIDDILSLFK